MGLKFKYTNEFVGSNRALVSTTLTGLGEPDSITEKLLKVKPSHENVGDGIGGAGGVTATSTEGGGGPGHAIGAARNCGPRLIRAAHTVTTAEQWTNFIYFVPPTLSNVNC